MNAVLWILQVLLAAQFAWHGWLLLSPPPELAEIITREFPLWFRVFLGSAEILAAVGLIVPGAARIRPGFLPLAAAGVMVVLASATVHHVARGEMSSAIITAGEFVVATFVAYMRWKVKPIPGRT